MRKSNWPRISIVTPSFNSVKYIEDTILSVLTQNYPNLEYIIIDGASTDGTVEIIKKYEKYLKYWVSEPDLGQSHAINKGFKQATGDILAWLNSDDLYLPNVLNSIFRIIESNSPNIALGECIHLEEKSDQILTYGSSVGRSINLYDLIEYDFIIQPASFWTRETWNIVGPLKEDLHYAFDWEWFIRARNKNISFYSLNKACSIYRIHEFHKTRIGGIKRQTEILEIYKKYNPRIASLYCLLIKETIHKSLIYKILSKSFLDLFFPKNGGGKIKLFKFVKYLKYSGEEITIVKSML